MVADVSAATLEVVIGKETVVAPAGTVTESGKLEDAELVLRVTRAPPAGAPWLRVIVPVDGLPPTTLVGLTLTL